MGWFFFWLVCVFGTAFVASSKNRNGLGWALLAIVLGPIAMLIVGLSAALPVTESAITRKGTRLCPFCAEEIKHQAVLCRHCGKDVPAAEVSQENGDIAAAYYDLQHQCNQQLSLSNAKLELKKMGYGSEKVAAFLDKL